MFAYVAQHFFFSQVGLFETSSPSLTAEDCGSFQDCEMRLQRSEQTCLKSLQKCGRLIRNHLVSAVAEERSSEVQQQENQYRHWSSPPQLEQTVSKHLLGPSQHPANC